MIIIALGGNAPVDGLKPIDVIRAAGEVLERSVGVTARSRLYRSPAWPDPADPEFVNAVLAVRPHYAPVALLQRLTQIEAAFGRLRSARWGPRTLDLDLLDYDGRTRAPDAESDLELPHPRMMERLFVLRPLLDIAPDWAHPETGEAAAQSVERLGTETEARPFSDDWRLSEAAEALVETVGEAAGLRT
ncbi:MAG: 2-amino-4-hydroxy-6-hydroxymethyldihydropteridine diphosphokinase [Pseudomonadota bacterium]